MRRDEVDNCRKIYAGPATVPKWLFTRPHLLRPAQGAETKQAPQPPQQTATCRCLHPCPCPASASAPCGESSHASRTLPKHGAGGEQSRKPAAGSTAFSRLFPGQRHGVSRVRLGTGDGREKRGWHSLDLGMDVAGP